MNRNYPSIIIPSHDRAERLVALVESINQTTPEPYQIVVISEDIAVYDLRIAGALPHVVLIAEDGTAVEKWNSGARWATGDWLVMLGDDCIVKPNWWEAVRDTPNKGFVGLNEGVPWTDEVGHWAMHRDLACSLFGGVLAIPHYKIWWFDQEMCQVLKREGLYARTEEIVLIHNHPATGAIPMDETYTRTQPWKLEDTHMFAQRKKAGFPVDWSPIIQRAPTERSSEVTHGLA